MSQPAPAPPSTLAAEDFQLSELELPSTVYYMHMVSNISLAGPVNQVPTIKIEDIQNQYRDLIGRRTDIFRRRLSKFSRRLSGLHPQVLQLYSLKPKSCAERHVGFSMRKRRSAQSGGWWS